MTSLWSRDVTFDRTRGLRGPHGETGALLYGNEGDQECSCLTRS
jgi:hypothetical protein